MVTLLTELVSDVVYKKSFTLVLL